MTTDSEINTPDEGTGNSVNTPATKRPKGNPAYADFGKGNLYSITDPFKVRIYGGLHLPEGERGPLDTAHKYGEHPLVTDDLLTPLEESFVESVRKRGITTPVIITSIDGVAAILNGRTGIRAARIVWREQEAAGLPQLTVPSASKPPNNMASHVITMVVTNHQRKVFTPLTMYHDAMVLIDNGVSPEDAATYVKLSVSKLDELIAIQGATTEVRDAVNSGRISISAGKFVAAQVDPEKQRAALAEALANGGSARAAIEAVRKSRGKGPKSVSMKRAALETMYSVIEGIADDAADRKTAGNAFALGYRAALEVALGLGIERAMVVEYIGVEAATMLLGEVESKDEGKDEVTK